MVGDWWRVLEALVTLGIWYFGGQRIDSGFYFGPFAIDRMLFIPFE